MNHPNVSVVVPVFNGETYLQTAINSILGQTYPVAGIPVVDGGSTDQTEAIARSFRQVTWLQQPGKDLANARNTIYPRL